MNRKPKDFAPQEQSMSTYFSKKRVEGALKLAKKLEEDPDQSTRHAQQLCKACYYFPAMAGQAFTTQPCACCHVDQTYSNTNTDALCMDCAKQHHLCKHCSGDIKMDTGRTVWPAPKHSETQG